MHDPASDLAAEWLTRAEHDLRVAVYLLTMPDPPAESIGFHAQQCAEKALRGFLTLHRIPFERRHDLNYLIDLCITHDRDFEQFRADADELTPYAVEYRYPDALPSMPLEPVRATVAAADRIYAFTMARMD
jgi:HEPN domain-containing protein